jgi:hypothetical protein
LCGLGNNQQAVFFGDAGETSWNERRLQKQLGEPHVVVRFIEDFLGAPRVVDVYNLGCARANSCSIMECFQIGGQLLAKSRMYNYVVWIYV